MWGSIRDGLVVLGRVERLPRLFRAAPRRDLPLFSHRRVSWGAAEEGTFEEVEFGLKLLLHTAAVYKMDSFCETATLLVLFSV